MWHSENHVKSKMQGEPECLNRTGAVSVRERLKAAIRAKREGRKPGAQLAQMNNALKALGGGNSASTLRGAQKELARAQRQLLNKGSEPSSVNPAFIDNSEIRDSVGDKPEQRPVLRAPDL